MTLTEMRYLVALARERHFGKAAESCHVSQPTLSVAIKKVESELGVTLFERNAADVRVTPLGEQLIAQASNVLAEAQRLHEMVHQGKDPLRGLLRVGVIYTIAPYLLPHLIPALHQRAPHMPLYLKEDFTHNLIPALKQGELDVLILAMPVNESGIVAQAVYREPFRLIAPKRHELAQQESVAADALGGENLLLLGQGNCFRDQTLEACPRVDIRQGPGDSFEGSSLETIRLMVASGMGIAVMPSSAADPLEGTQELVKVLPFTEPEPHRQVGLAWRVTFPRHAVIDVLKAAIRDCQIPGVRF